MSKSFAGTNAAVSCPGETFLVYNTKKMIF